jgi:multicomponent Na+:H+ antiporter subunit F
MDDLLLAVAAFLVLNVAAGLVRVARGPSPADRMLVAQLFGTTGVAILLLLAEAQRLPGLRIVALVFALLAVVISVAFVKRGWVRTDPEASGEAAGSPSGGEDR